MARLLSLLIVVALVFTNGAAVAAAACQHEDARAHALALQSPDAGIAAEAMEEDRMAAKAMQKSTLADAAAVQLAGFLLPSTPTIPAPESSEPMNRHPGKAAELANRAIPPLLEPPLA